MSGAVSEQVVRSAVPAADLSHVDKALATGGDELKAALSKVRPADVGRDFSRRTAKQSKQILEASDDRSAAAMLRSANPAVAGPILEACEPAHAARVILFMPTDHQVRVLGALSEERKQRIHDALQPEHKAYFDRILSHGESAVARLMTPKIWRCDVKKTAGEAMALLGDHCTEIEVAQNCYVVDGDKLVGVAPLRQIAIAPPATPLESLMARDVISVTEDSGRGDAAEIMQTHDFLSLPVVDHEGKLVGAVRVDDVLDAALAKVGTGFLNQGGIHGDLVAEVPYFKTSLFKVVRSRITWLVLLFVAETATGTVLRHFEDELAKVVALSFFIPLLIGTGGNAGSQTVSTIIRALALREVKLRDIGRVVLKEVSAGLLLGILLGTIAFGRALLWGVSYDLAACVGITVLVVCTWANTVGAVIPLAAQRFGIDPTVISGPLITTLVDASGLFLYLTIAKLMISQLHG